MELRSNERSTYRHASIAQFGISTMVDVNLKRACPAWIAPDSGSLQGIRSHHAGFTLRTSSGAVPLVIYFLRVLSPPSPQIKPLPFRNGNCTPNRKLSQVYVLSMKWPKRAGIRRRDRKLSIISDLEPRIRELIRLIAAEVDPGKRKMLAEELERLLN